MFNINSGWFLNALLLVCIHNTQRTLNADTVGSIMCQSCKWWPNIEPARAQRFVFAGTTVLPSLHLIYIILGRLNDWEQHV